MSITDVRHQDRAIDRFQQAMESDRLSHAYILVGPTGVGKTMTAIRMAQVLLCERPVSIDRMVDGSPRVWRDGCGTCPSCRLVAAGTHPDLHVVYKELIATVAGKETHKATELGIDVIRQEVIEKVGLKPLLGRRKVFVLEEAELMSRSAQNALLKTLEEPPGNTHLFLISEQVGGLLATIRSRAQTLSFALLPAEFVRDRLTEAGAREAVADFLSRLVPGRLGTALEFFRLGVYDLKERLGHELAALEPSIADDFVQWILDESKGLADQLAQTADSAPRPVRVSESELTRTAVKLILALLGGFYRDGLRVVLGFPAETLLNGDQAPVVRSLASDGSPDQFCEKIRTLSAAERWIDANVNVTLVVTNVVGRITLN